LHSEIPQKQGKKRREGKKKKKRKRKRKGKETLVVAVMAAMGAQLRQMRVLIAPGNGCSDIRSSNWYILMSR
jgi:hypothetical protein